VWNETGDVVGLARGLHDWASRDAAWVIADIVSGAHLHYVDAAYALWHAPLVSDSDQLVLELFHGGAGFDTLVGILQTVVGFTYEDAYLTVVRLLGL